MSYKSEVQSDDTGNWHGNSLRFATKDEAIAYNLMMRQFTVSAATRVVETDDPINYARGGEHSEVYGPKSWCHRESRVLEHSRSDYEILFTIRPADVPGFSLGDARPPGRLNAEDKHLPEAIGCPVVFLTSGQKLTLHKVMLYDEDGVQEIAKLRAQAAKSLGGGSLGVGVIGSPGWTLLGEAAAISIIGGCFRACAEQHRNASNRAKEIGDCS